MRTETTALLVGVFALAGAHCSTSSDSGANAAPGDDGGTADGGDAGPARPDTCDDHPDPHCAHPMNRVLVPMFRAAGMPMRDASAQELCRRMSIDLIGRAPTDAEMSACVTKTPDQMADALISMPEYAAHQARWWTEHGKTGVDLLFKTWYGDAFDLGELIRSAYAGKSYSDFVADFVVHPGFYVTHPNDDWTRATFDLFLGRTARPDEVAAMRPLTQVWSPYVFCDGYFWFYHFKNDPGEAAANTQCLQNVSFQTAYLNACQCAAPFGCRSTALGKPIDFGGAGCTMASDPTNAVNLRHAQQAYWPGKRAATSCDGQGTPGCADRGYSYAGSTSTISGPLSAVAALSGPERAAMHQLGDALAARPDFWEAAAARELRIATGWWADGVRVPDYVVPDVLAVVAAHMKRTNSISATQKLIVTSLLYAAPSEKPEVDAKKSIPIWASGPTKYLVSEPFLDSLAVATLGTPAGYCDYRFVMSGASTPNIDFVDPALVAPSPNPLGIQLTSDMYNQAAQQLGGCSADVTRPRISSVGTAYAQRSLAQMFCALGDPVVLLPPTVADTTTQGLEASAAFLVKRLLLREATAAEKTALAADMAACLGAPSGTGCDGGEAAARWLCARLASSAFLVY